jgi:hypothetical protein
VPAVRLVVGLEPPEIDALRQALQAVEMPAGRAPAQVDAALILVVVVTFVPLAPFVVRGSAPDAIHLVEKTRQLRRFDAQELHIDLRRIHRHHRQATILSGRQHGAATGEEPGRRHVVDLRFTLVRGGEQVATARTHARRDIDAVASFRQHAGEIRLARIVAQAPVPGHACSHRRAARLAQIGHRHQVAKLLARRQRPTEGDGERRAILAAARIATQHGERRIRVVADRGDALLRRLLRLPPHAGRDGHRHCKRRLEPEHPFPAHDQPARLSSRRRL